MSTPSSETPAKGKRLALVIGVNQAPRTYLPPLQHAIADAEAMAKVLEHYGKFELIEPPLLGTSATSDATKKAILRLMRGRTDDDVLLLYFSGHGLPMPIKKEDQPDFNLIYLVTSDFCEQEVEEDTDLHLSMRWLRDKFFVSTKAGRVLVILDCCFSGDYARTGRPIQLEELLQQIAHYFDQPGTARGAPPGGLRWTLTATGHNQPTEEKDGHGLLTGPLLKALHGKVDTVLGQDGQITLNVLYNYLFDVMPSGQKPSLSGDSAARDYILAWHKRPPKRIVNKQPRTYIPFFRNLLFQPRPNDFQQLETLIFDGGEEQKAARSGWVGIVGLSGMGKTRLAIEFAYRYLERFPAGVFWITVTGTSMLDWQQRFAQLAVQTEYLPPDDDVSHPENEQRRAQYFCRYLADHRDALLILDNVEDPYKIVSVLPLLAGEEITCAIIYTSHNRFAPSDFNVYTVEQLPEEAAWRLLLQTTRQTVLVGAMAPDLQDEVQATHQICQAVGYLPLALVLLRELLAQDPQLSLTRLWEVLRQRGVIDLPRPQKGEVAPLFAAFALNWEKVHDEAARNLFKLACYFPEAAPIPLWLLGLAIGLGESGDILEPLGEACIQLQRLSLFEQSKKQREQVLLHPLVREFGRRLVTQEGEQGARLLQEAGERLLVEFTDLNKLIERSRQAGYWTCLEQVRAVRAYIARLARTEQAEQIKRIERWMSRESYLLADEHWWPNSVPALFYQQLFNRSIEEGYPLTTRNIPGRWLKLTEPVGAENRSLLRIFGGHSAAIASVTFSPDGTLVLTGSHDYTARLWQRSSGELLATYEGHTDRVSSAAFSPDGKLVLTGSHDYTARLWERDSSKLLYSDQKHAGSLWSIAFSLDGEFVLTGSTNGTAQLWECDSDGLRTTYQGHTDWVSSVAFSPNGKVVLTGSHDGTARLWERNSGKLLVTYQRHTSWIWSVTFSPDGQFVLTGSDDGTARLWDCTSGRLLVTYQKGLASRISSLSFSSNGKLILTGSTDGIIHLWERDSARLLAIYQGYGGWIWSVAFSPNEKFVLTGSSDGTAQLWECDSARLLVTYQGYGSPIYKVTFSPDGKLIIACDAHGRVFFWDGRQPNIARLLGIYGATYEVGAIYWQDATHVVLTDKGGPGGRPHFYRLSLEGEW